MKLTIPTDRKIYESQSAYHWFDDDQIFFSVAKDSTINYQTVRDTINLIATIFEGAKFFGIVETTGLKLLDKRTRALISEETPKFSRAIAIVSASPMSRILGNIIFGFTGGDFPRKAFSSVTEAKKWLAQLQERDPNSYI